MAYSEEDKKRIIDDICESISNGLSLRKSLLRDGMPKRNTFFEWIDADVNKSNQYARACEERAELIFEDILHIADDTTKDTKTVDIGGVEIEQINHDAIQRSRLKVDARKWMLSKMMPKKYGERMQHANDPDNPIQSNIKIEIIEPEI